MSKIGSSACQNAPATIKLTWFFSEDMVVFKFFHPVRRHFLYRRMSPCKRKAGRLFIINKIVLRTTSVYATVNSCTIIIKHSSVIHWTTLNYREFQQLYSRLCHSQIKIKIKINTLPDFIIPVSSSLSPILPACTIKLLIHLLILGAYRHHLANTWDWEICSGSMCLTFYHWKQDNTWNVYNTITFQNKIFHCSVPMIFTRSLFLKIVLIFCNFPVFIVCLHSSALMLTLSPQWNNACSLELYLVMFLQRRICPFFTFRSEQSVSETNLVLFVSSIKTKPPVLLYL